MTRRTAVALTACILAGCGGELESDYTLTLVPHVLTGQDPFATPGAVLEVVFTDPAGKTEIFHAGPLEGGEARADELPPIAAGTTVGLAVEEPGGTAGQIDVDLVVAWGSAVAEQPLGADGKTITLDVLLPEVGRVGEMGTLPGAQRSLGAGVAMIPGGDVYIFGGTEDFADVPTNRILHLTNADSGEFKFTKLSEKLTVRDGITGKFGVAAATVYVNDEPMIFVHGGREDTGTLPGVPSTAGYLFDPATQEITWGHKDTHDVSDFGWSEHKLLVMDNQRVVMFGGYKSSLQNNTVEIFNPTNKRYDFISSGSHGEVMVAGASLAGGGALLCGGGVLGAGQSQPIDACDQITLGGILTSSDPLPTAVMGHAMTRLASGDILATGGVTVTVADNGRAPATDEAWLYNGNNWTPLTANMKNARAHHEIIPLPDGNAVVIGGTEEGGPIFPTAGPAVPCPELYDAKAGTFIELNPCTNAGAGQDPKWSAVANEGAFVLAGQDQLTGTNELGDAYGFVGFPPE